MLKLDCEKHGVWDFQSVQFVLKFKIEGSMILFHTYFG